MTKSQIDLQPSEKIVTIRKDGSKRIQLKINQPSLTDQSMAKATDINNILKQYSTAGITPQVITDPSYYRDNSNIPTFHEAFNIVNNAVDEFSKLHPDLRKLMDNDPSNLESFILDPNNRDYLEKYDITVKKNSKPTDEIPKVIPPKETKKDENTPKSDT